MANLQHAAASGAALWPRVALTDNDLRRHDDLARRVDLIEIRPEDVLTWSDVARFVRSAARRFGAAVQRAQGLRRNAYPVETPPARR